MTQPSTSAQQLNELPELAVFHILEHLEAADVLKCRLVSRRLSRLVERNEAYLRRPNKSALLYEVKYGRTGRFSRPHHYHMVAIQHENLSRGSWITRFRESAPRQSLGMLRMALRKFVYTHRLGLCAIQLNTRVLHEFQQSWVDLGMVKELSLSYCDLQCKVAELMSVLGKASSCENLSIEFCRAMGSYVNDQLMASFPHLQHFTLQSEQSIKLPDLTDRTIEIWLSRPHLIRTICLGHAQTGFTLSGVFAMVEGLVQRLRAGRLTAEAGVHWRFGRIADSPLSLLEFAQRQQTRPAAGFALEVGVRAVGRLAVTVRLEQSARLRSAQPMDALQHLALFGCSLPSACASVEFELVG